MPFFRRLEDILEGSGEKANWGNLATGAIAFDEHRVVLLRDILRSSTEVVLLGPRDSGKTVTAKVLGFRLLTEENLACFYGSARDLTDISEAAAEVQAYEAFSGRTLFILEDCHTSTNLVRVEALLQRLGGDRRNTALLLTTRNLGVPDSILRALAKEHRVVRLDPATLRASIVRRHIDQLRREPSLADSAHFPKEETQVEAQLSGLLRRLPSSNLRILDLYLQVWNPRTEPLAEVEERRVLDRLLTRSPLDLTSPDAMACLLPLWAIDQYEVGVHMSFFDDPNALSRLKDTGTILYDGRTGLCRLPDPSEAPWYLRAAEQAHLLRVEGHPTDLKAFVRHHILRYGAMAPNPQDLLRGLHDDRGLALAVIGDPGFQQNLRRLAAEAFFRVDLPDLLLQLRSYHEMDLCLQVARVLTDSDLDELGRQGADTVGQHLCQFLSWPRDYRRDGRQFAARLTQQPSVQPQLLAREFMAGLDSKKYGVHHLATLLFALNNLGTYDVPSFLRALDLPQLKAQFPETRLTRYAALLREVKRARAGIAPVRELTPELPMVRDRVIIGSARPLRDIMDALLMPQRKRLWADLSDQELEAILSKSTLNQLYNFLEDALESRNQESRLLGRDMAARLVDLDVAELMAKSDLSDVSMFAHAAILLNSDLSDRILSQVLRAGLEGIAARETHKDQVVSKISLMLKDFYPTPDVARRFLTAVTQLNLLPYIQASEDGLRYLTYGALMTDKELSRQWFLEVGQQTWEDKLGQAPEDETFWIVWNLWQVEPALACSLANVAPIRDKIAKTLHGLGLLMLCGFTTVDAATALMQLPSSLAEPWDASQLALTLQALCRADLREVALRVKASLDLRKVEDTLQDAKVLLETRELFVRILAGFKNLAG